MIITDKFVMLNYPKTGSTFVRQMLKKVHINNDTWLGKVKATWGLTGKPPMIELYDRKGPGVPHSQHGSYQQIPDEHKGKLIVSVVRNPLQRYISEYLYGWWKEHPENFRDEISQGFHRFPELSFKEYFEMISLSAKGESGKDVGYETVRFVKFFCKDPNAVLSQLDDEYIQSGRYREDLPEIKFLHQENLNDELAEFLSGMGYRHTDIQVIRKAGRINVTDRRQSQSDETEFFKDGLMHDVLKRDKLLFALFPEYATAR